MPGEKTREQQVRNFERKPDVPDERQMNAALTDDGEAHGAKPRPREGARQRGFPVSAGGINQENRDHNKHNHQTQPGHGPQKHTLAEEKQS